jgi:hypothetical protein
LPGLHVNPELIEEMTARLGMEPSIKLFKAVFRSLIKFKAAVLVEP